MQKFEYKVKRSDKGKKLGTFLYEKLGDWSHKQIKNAIDKKRVFVNSKNIFISGWQLKVNDRVTFHPKQSDFPNNPISQSIPSYSKIDIIFEDEYLIVANKPPYRDYESFVGDMNHYLRSKQTKNFLPYLGQMHRLDKETSGIILFTKKKIANSLADQFRDRSIKKEYLAIARGKISKEGGKIDFDLEKTDLKGGKKVHVVKKGTGMKALTLYHVEERYKYGTLLRVQLKTGRTHQIRVHLSEIGHPLWGEKMYKKQNDVSREKMTRELLELDKICKRHALHAWKVQFHHPVTNELMNFKSPIPVDLEKFIDKLREYC